MFRTKIKRTGNSLSCCVPKPLAEKIGVVSGTEVELIQKEKGFEVVIIKKYAPLEIYSESELVSDMSRRKSFADLLG